MAKRPLSPNHDHGPNPEGDGQGSNVPSRVIGNVTPTSRIIPKSTSQASKERVDKMVSGGRCLVENVSPHRGVEYVHCFARSFWGDNLLMTKLEWYWGMGNSTLHLDTRYNIFRAGASIHRMYDDGLWMFLPEDDTITDIHDGLKEYESEWHAVRGEFPKFQDTSFNYRLLPASNNMIEVTIVRQNDANAPALPSDATVHIFPFDTLPQLESHLRPQFVILNTGLKMKNLREKANGSQETQGLVNMLTTSWPIIEKLENIYEAWMRPTHPTIMDDTQFSAYRS